LAELVLENTIYAQSGNAAPSPFVVRVFRPEPFPDGGGFECRVEMSHKPRPFAVGGADPLQALVLAISYLNIEFKSLVQRGWRFSYEPDASEFFDPASTYFPVRG
jgi:hypothetical protein